MNRLMIVFLFFVSLLMSGCFSIEHDRLATQRSVAASGATIEQAHSAQRIAESEASVDNFRTLAEAAKPDNSVLLVVLIGFIGLAILVVYKLFEVNMMVLRNQAKPAASPKLLPHQHDRTVWLLADGRLVVERYGKETVVLEPDHPLYDRLLTG